MVGVLAFVLSSSVVYPRGIVDFEKWESEPLLIAEREGAANCLTTLKLRKDKTFIERTICFGQSETTGTYNVVNDTIYFENVWLGPNEDHYFKFATIAIRKDSGKYSGEILRFKNHKDSTGVALWILKNDLSINPITSIK